MKTKKFNKKLVLNKSTITHLDQKEQVHLKGGYFATALYATCYTWHPVCRTRPVTYTDICMP